VYHFTPDKYWTNDPNGLIYLNGKFQLYYQHNPQENKWGHMSWGHAESTDLVHWKHLPVAIPEVVTKDTTLYIYSGSAVIDKSNTSGFGKNGKGPIVAIFTGDLPKQQKEAQYIAYSNDNGMSYKLYDKNPVIDLNKRDFSDPNVFWYAPKKQWIMTVSMVNEFMVRFYGSKDLKHWEKLSDFGPAGYTKNGWECPSMLPLPVDGNPANTKYVLFVSNFGEQCLFIVESILRDNFRRGFEHIHLLGCSTWHNERRRPKSELVFPLASELNAPVQIPARIFSSSNFRWQ